MSNRFNLEGRTALVTGGARDCGLAFVEGLAEAGADIAIFDIIPPVDAFFAMEGTTKSRSHTTSGLRKGTKKESIVQVASIASYMAIKSQTSSAYCGTKGAVRAMCPAIAAELVKYGIRVNTIYPGYVRTENDIAFPTPSRELEG